MARGTEHFQISILGAPGVGKTALANRLLALHPPSRYDPALGDPHYTQLVVDGGDCTVHLFDTQSRRSALARDSDAAILVYAITSNDSFARLRELFEVLKKEKVGMGIWDPFQIWIAGNKLDLASSREVTADQVRPWAKKNGCGFEECSVETNQNIDSIPRDLVRRIRTYRDNERIRYEQLQEKTRKMASRQGFWRRMFGYVGL